MKNERNVYFLFNCFQSSDIQIWFSCILSVLRPDTDCKAINFSFCNKFSCFIRISLRSFWSFHKEIAFLAYKTAQFTLLAGRRPRRGTCPRAGRSPPPCQALPWALLPWSAAGPTTTVRPRAGGTGPHPRRCGGSRLTCAGSDVVGLGPAGAGDLRSSAGHTLAAPLPRSASARAAEAGAIGHRLAPSGRERLGPCPL